MSDSDKNFVVTKRDLWVVGIAMSIIVALVGLGFGLVSGVPLAATEYPTGENQIVSSYAHLNKLHHLYSVLK